MYDLILKNCNVVNENKKFESDIGIKNNRIELIASNISSESKQVVDIEGRHVIPGLIDDQVHFREPGLTHKGTIATESRAGLAGGVTSFFEMPNVNPTTTTNENLTKNNINNLPYSILLTEKILLRGTPTNLSSYYYKI